MSKNGENTGLASVVRHSLSPLLPQKRKNSYLLLLFLAGRLRTYSLQNHRPHLLLPTQTPIAARV